MRARRDLQVVALGCGILAGTTFGCQSGQHRFRDSAHIAGVPGTPGVASPAAAAPQPSSRSTTNRTAGQPRRSESPQGDVRQGQIRPVAYRRSARQSGRLSLDGDGLFAGQRQLELPRLIDEVLVRNRSAQAMMSAWQAASQRYPQAVSLEDPVFMSMFAPASFASNQVQPGYILGASQKIPWAGKRPLRGQVARAEASSAYMDFQDLRLQLIEATQLAFLDYYLARRELELNAANREQLRQFRETARAKYESGSAPQQDLLQADVELAELGRRQIELQRGGRIAAARINTLLHLAPDAALPAAPPALETGVVLASAKQLRESAVTQRPDLAALGAKIRAARASLALSYREFYPDLELYGRYDSFWQPSSQRDLRAQVGMNLNVPVYKDRRRAAASEAMYRLRQQQAEYEQRVDDIHREVQSAYEQFDGSRRVVELYSHELLPAAERNVESARADYEAGQADFLRLVAAERQLIVLQERQQEAIVDYHRHLVQLERATGGPVLSTPAKDRVDAVRPD